MQVNIFHVKRLSDGLSEKEKERFQLKQIWSNLATFLTTLGQLHPYTEGISFSRDVLKEDAELQGFAALKRAIDERPLSMIPTERISFKNEMQIRIADMFEDALALSRVDWVDFFATTTEMADGKQGLKFSTRREEGTDMIVTGTRPNAKGSALASGDSEDETDYEREAKDEDLNPFHIRKGVNFNIQKPPATSATAPVDNGADEEAAVDHDVNQRQAVAALLSDDDNDLSLIVGNDDDEDEDEEEEVVLFKGRSTVVGGKPTPRPAHLRTATGVIGAGRRGSMSPIGSSSSSPGLDVHGPSRFGPLRPSPTVDSLFGGFEFGAVDDWRHSINSLRTSPTSNTWGGLSSNSLGNGTISPTTYEPHDGNILSGFTSIPSRAPPGISFPASPLSANPPGFMNEEQHYHHQQQQEPRHVSHALPKHHYQPHGFNQQQQQSQFQYNQNGAQSMRDGDWR